MGPAGIAPGDVNGDGKAAMAVTSYKADTDSVHLGNMNGTFVAKTVVTVAVILSHRLHSSDCDRRQGAAGESNPLSLNCPRTVTVERLLPSVPVVWLLAQVVVFPSLGVRFRRWFARCLAFESRWGRHSRGTSTSACAHPRQSRSVPLSPLANRYEIVPAYSADSERRA